jgi:hypothetical protein
MHRIRTLFLILTIVGPMHMAEQLLFGIEEFFSIKGYVASYYGWFEPAAADHATVILITVVWTMTSLLFYGLLREGTARLVVLGIFGLFGAQEVHHVIESFQTGAYDPGVVTCVPYSVLGVLLLSAVWREHKRGSAVASDDSSRLTFDRRPGVSYEGR